MDYRATAVLAWLACFCAISAAYSPAGYSSVPAPQPDRPPAQGVYRERPGRGHSKVIRRPAQVQAQSQFRGQQQVQTPSHFRGQQQVQSQSQFRGQQQVRQDAYGATGGLQLGTQQGHGSAHSVLGAAHFQAKEAHENAHSTLGAAHFAAQQSHEDAHSALGAAHFSAQQAHQDAHATLGAAHYDAQQAHQDVHATLGAAHYDAHQAHQDAHATLGAAQYDAQQAHESAHASVGSAYSTAQEAHESAHTSAGTAYRDAQEAYAEAQAGLTDARESVREAYARAQAAIQELAFFASQSRLSLSTSYILNNARFIISRHFGTSKVKPPRIIVRDAASNGVVCVPVNSFNASWVAGGLSSSAASVTGGQSATVTGGQGATVTGGQGATVTGGQGATVTGGQSTSGTGSAAAGQVHLHGSDAGGREFVQAVGDEVHKAVKPFQTIGQGHGILVTVTSASSGYSSAGGPVSGASGYAAASVSPSGVSLSAGHKVHGVGGAHEETVSVHGQGTAHHGTGSELATVHGGSGVDGPETFPSSAGQHTGFGVSRQQAGYAQTTSGKTISGTSESASTSTGKTEKLVGSGSTAGHALASPAVLLSSAGGKVISSGGKVASASRSTYSSSESGHGASTVSTSGHGASKVSTSGHGASKVFTSGHGASVGSSHQTSGGASLAEATVGSDGRATLYVSGPHAEAATAGGDGSAVHLSSSGGLSHHGLADCECVPDYLCDEDGLINTSGAGIISVRSFSMGGTAAAVDPHCPRDHVCCRHGDQREPVLWRPLDCGTRSPVRLDRRVVSGEVSQQVPHQHLQLFTLLCSHTAILHKLPRAHGDANTCAHTRTKIIK